VARYFALQKPVQKNETFTLTFTAQYFTIDSINDGRPFLAERPITYGERQAMRQTESPDEVTLQEEQPPSLPEDAQKTPNDTRDLGKAPEQQTRKWAVFGIVAIGIYMATLDTSIVNISLPSISAYFHVPLSGLVEWVIIAYLVTIASVQLTFGRLADMLGRKPLWMAGLVVFTLGSVLCGAAPTLLLLVIFRAFQGIGGALLMSNSTAMLTRAFPARERGRILGLNSVVVSLGVSTGPTLGGLITTLLSWRWIFFVNLPIGILGLILTFFVLKEPAGLYTRQRFDPLGAVVLSAGMLAIMFALSFGQEAGWASPLILGLFIAGLMVLVGFVLIERRVTDPIIDLKLFRNRLFAAANLSGLLSFFALFAVSFLLPFYLEELRHFPTDEAGLLLTPIPLSVSLVAPVSGWLSDRFGSRVLSSAGLATSALGLWLLTALGTDTAVFDIVWRLIIVGVGIGLFQSPNNSAVMGAVPPERRGIGSGFLATVRVVGQSLSVAVAGAVFASLGAARAGRMLATNQSLSAAQLANLQATFLSGFHSALLVCMCIASIGVITSLVRGSQRT
jgi:EmrB/QacA subfamily drug resistance transporter